MGRLPPTPWSRVGDGSLSRRRLLKILATSTALLGANGCTGADDDQEPAPQPTELPTPTPLPTQPFIASPVPGYVNPERWAGRTVTVASLGGDYQNAQAEAFFTPFADATGALVQLKNVDLGELRQQVEQESVTWDLADIPTEDVLPLARADYLMPIDYQRVDQTLLLPEIVMQHGVGATFFSTTIIYPRTSETKPAGWRDFWDVDAIPGSRALRHSPIGTLEFALLADGVALDELYPLDVERAFLSLDRIRPHVAQWYENSLQPVALVETGDVALASSYNVIAQTEQGLASVAPQWNGGMLSADSWVVPRGAPNADVAMDMINFATRAIPGANFSRLLPFGPVNTDAFALLEPARLALLPSTEPHRAVQFIQNWNWWADNREPMTERFNAWVIQDAASPGEGTPGSTESSRRHTDLLRAEQAHRT